MAKLRPSAFYRLLKSHPLVDTPVLRRALSDDIKKRASLLSRSTAFLQDGISITELPILIRRLDKSLIPVSTNKLSLDDIQKISEQDEMFQMKLQDCSSAKEVFKLLEIPAEQVTAYTAAFALDRLCQLQKARNNDLETIHSFIRDAVLKELCDTIVRGVGSLTSETLLSMVDCALKTNFPAQTTEGLILEVEKRLSDSRFSISQLCELSERISSDESFTDLVHNIQIHFSFRTDEMDEKNIAKVYEALGRKRTLSTKSTLKSIERTLMNCWWLLDAKDTATILTALVHLNHKSVQILTVFGKLMFLNIQNFKQPQLKKVIFAYIHFNFSNNYLFKSLERYATAKNSAMDSNVTALIMEYCRCCRHLSVPIFDSVAVHLKEHGEMYSPDELYLILRPFGQLNYLPTKAGPVFVKVESHLANQLEDYPPHKMIELLTSFAYIERFPINFVRKIFTPYTFSMVNNIPNPALRDATCRNLMKLQSAVKIEWQDCRIPYLFSYDASKDRWTDQHHYRILCEMKSVLKSLLPGHDVYQSEKMDHSPYILDFLIEKKEECQVPVLPHNQLAVVVSTSLDFTTNTGTPLGDYAMKLRHIRIRGLGLIEVSRTEYCQSSNKDQYLQSKLGEQESIRFHELSIVKAPTKTSISSPNLVSTSTQSLKGDVRKIVPKIPDQK